MALPQVSGEGNLTADPEVKYVTSGKAVANVNVASTERKKDQNGEWEDGDQAFLRLEVWGDEAERLAAWGYKGCAVIYRGQLRIREFEGRDGTRGKAVEVKFCKVAPDPARNDITVRKAQRSGGQGGSQQPQGGGGRAWGGSGQQGGAQGQQGMQEGSGWGRTGGSKWGRGTPVGGQATQPDPWAAAPAPGQSEDPPF